MLATIKDNVMDYSFFSLLKPELISAFCINSKNLPENIYNYGLRKVMTYELDFITWGEGYILTDGNKSPATKGKLFIRTPGMSVDGFLPYHCYYLRLNLFEDNSKPLLPKDFPTEIVFTDPLKLEDLFSNIYRQHILQSATSKFLIRAYLMEIFRLVLETLNQLNGLNKSSENTRCKSIAEIAGYIEENAQLDFSLEVLSQMSRYSRFAFCREFKLAIGSTPIEYANKCKIQRARILLLETDKSIKEISFDCGFDNESYFYILFKKLAGCSPTKYRKDNRMW